MAEAEVQQMTSIPLGNLFLTMKEQHQDLGNGFLKRSGYKRASLREKQACCHQPFLNPGFKHIFLQFLRIFQ